MTNNITKINDYRDRNEKGQQTFAQYKDIGRFVTIIESIPNPPTQVKTSDLHHFRSQEDVLDFVAQRQLKAMGKNGKALTPEEQHNYMLGIAPSLVNRMDTKTTIQVENCKPMTVYTQWNKNGDANGTIFDTNEGRRIVHSGIASSDDRNTPHAQMMRKVSDGEITHAYTGRPETDDKAIELATYIFQQEREGAGKGIRSIGNDEQGRPILELTFIVDSLLSASPYTYVWRNPDRHERRIILNEKKALENLRNNQKGITIKDPKTGQDCQVRCKPILMQNVFNWATEVDQAFPDWFSGKSVGDKITNNGLAQLQAYAKSYKASLGGSKEYLEENLDNALKIAEKFQSYSPEKKIVVLAMLAHACEIPLAIHCMSSKDRTGISIALVSAFHQYRKLGKFVDIDTMLKDEKFKEFFCANLMIAHNNANYGRGAEGEIYGEKLGELFGLDVTANQTFLRLLPQRYLKEGPHLAWKVVAAIISVVVAPLIIICGLIENTRKLYTERSVVPLATFLLGGFIFDIFRFIGNAYKLIPSFQLDKKSDYVNGAGRNFTKMKQTHPLTDSMQKFIQTVEDLSVADFDMLKLGIMDLNNLYPLTERQKEIVIYICLNRDCFSRILEVPTLENQIPDRTKEFISAARNSDLFKFETSDEVTRKRIVDFFNKGGIWNLRPSSHEVESQVGPFIRVGQDVIDEKSLESQFFGEYERLTPTTIDNDLFEATIQKETKILDENVFENILSLMVARGITRDKALRILCLCQQGSQADRFKSLIKVFGQPELDALSVWQLTGVTGAHVINTTEKKIILTAPFCFANQSSVNRQKEVYTNLLVTTTIDIETEFATFEFTVSDPTATIEKNETTPPLSDDESSASSKDLSNSLAVD